MNPARPSSARCCRVRWHAPAPSGSPAPPPSATSGAGLRIPPAAGPFIAGVNCFVLVGIWLVPKHRRLHALPSRCNHASLILAGDFLWVYLPAPAELQCPVGDCSMKYSGAIWTCRVQSERRHVEFEHGARVNDRIYVCSVCDSPLTSRPSYHRCLATATFVPSTETPRRRCGICDAKFTTKRGLANHLRCQGTLDATSTEAGPSGTARERAPARRVRHVSTSSSDTSSSSSAVRRRPWARPPSPVRRHHLLPPSPVPSEQPLRDAGGTSTPTPHIGVPTPAGVPVGIAVHGSPLWANPASPRPSLSARQALGPVPNRAFVVVEWRVSRLARLVGAFARGDAAFFLLHEDDDNTLSYDVALSSPPPDAGSSPVVLPESPVSPASFPSPPASVNEAAAVLDEPDEVQEQPESDNVTLRMPPNHTRLLEDQACLLRSLLRDPPCDESWAQCEEGLDAGRRLGCRRGASPAGASWSPAPPARPIERGRHPAAVPPQPLTRSSADPGGTTSDVHHSASGSARTIQGARGRPTRRTLPFCREENRLRWE
ncbi:hypothetical protein MRX96_044997 [Rhipicephalus microplus]